MTTFFIKREVMQYDLTKGSCSDGKHFHFQNFDCEFESAKEQKGWELLDKG